MAIPSIISQSDLVATVPTAVGHVFERAGLIRTLAPPFDPPSFAVKQYWHARFRGDLRNRWLRSRIDALFRAEWRP